MPFTNIIDWSRFSIVVKRDIINFKPAMDELLQFLQDLRNHTEVLAQYKRALSFAAYLLDHDKINWPSVYHLTLLQMKSEDQFCDVQVGDKKALSYLCHSQHICWEALDLYKTGSGETVPN